MPLGKWMAAWQLPSSYSSLADLAAFSADLMLSPPHWGIKIGYITQCNVHFLFY